MPNASIRARAASALETSYEVEAIDGSIGKIADATLEADSGHLVVDTGPLDLRQEGHAAGRRHHERHANEKVFVNRTKDEVKNAPEFDDSYREDEKYRTELGTYYGRGAVGTAIGTELRAARY